MWFLAKECDISNEISCAVHFCGPFLWFWAQLFKARLKCPYDQIFDFHFFTFSCTIRPSYSSCQISIHYEHQKSFYFNIYFREKKKSECMLIHRGSFIGPHPPIYLGDNTLERVTYSRLLGVDIDDKLNWSVHIKGLKKSFVNKLSLMKKSRFLPKQDLLNLYFKVIIPAVTYGISVWGGTNRSDDFDSLESLHCRAARVIFNFPKDLPSVEALTRAKWDTLRTYYKHSILKLIYKMYFNDSPPCMTAHIAKSQPSYNLRNSLKLEIPKFKSNIKKSSVSYRGAILWNLLPSGCRMADGVNSFSKIINNLTLVKDINFANIYCRR